LVLLLETGSVDARISESLNYERAREVTALIPDRSRSKDDQILDRSPDDLSEIHRIIRNHQVEECSAMPLLTKILRHHDSGTLRGEEPGNCMTHAVLSRAQVFLPDSQSSFQEFPDGRLPAHWNQVKESCMPSRLASLTRMWFLPRLDDAHQDHRLLGRMAPTVWRDPLVLTARFRNGTVTSAIQLLRAHLGRVGRRKSCC